MKVENFEAAVHFYGKAIELNPANAVYFCNRCNLEYGGGGSFCQGPGRAVGENGESGGTQGWGGDGSAAILNGTPGQVGSQASVSVSRYKHGHSACPGLPLLATLPLPHQVARETGSIKEGFLGVRDHTTAHQAPAPPLSGDWQVAPPMRCECSCG